MLLFLVHVSLWEKNKGKKQALREYFLTQQLNGRDDADALGSR